MKAMDLQLEDGQDNPSCAITSGICDPNVSLRTGKNRQKVTPSLCPAPLQPSRRSRVARAPSPARPQVAPVTQAVTLAPTPNGRVKGLPRTPG